MLENLTLALYFIIGYVVTYLALETAWHFTACRLTDKTIKPCVFKQMKAVTVRSKYR